MGNIIRLGIARIGLAVHSMWTTTSKKVGRKPPVVLLILGAQEAGKSTIASRISKHGKYSEEEAVYVPTKGFSIIELKDRGTAVRLYDLGGSEAVRELWPHYYPDAHGIIYVVDTSGKSSSIGKQTEILSKLIQDEHVKRKPLLVLGNKQDVETLQTEQLITQMDLIQKVNTAKCLTRVDMTSKVKMESFEDGLMIGFRWMITYVKWHWAELSERVEYDSMLEKSRENAKFEAMHLKSKSSPKKVEKDEEMDMGPVGSPSHLSIRSSTEEPEVIQNEDTVLMILPQKRLDPEGGNDVKEWKPDATHQVVLQPDTEDEFPEVVIVESRAEVHVQRPRSESAVTLNSSVMSFEAACLNAVPEDSVRGGAIEAETEAKSTAGGNSEIPPPTIIKPKTSQGPQGRPKLFRNKTAPVKDEPIRIPITAHMNGKPGPAHSIFQI